MKRIDCTIIGGGIAGLQAAIQLGRYTHTILVIDSNKGRSTIARDYQNILGFPQGVSGQELRKLGKEHASKFGVVFMDGTVTSLIRSQDKFLIRTEANQLYESRTVFLGTGITDHFPAIKNLHPTLGSSTYICPDCDGHEITNKKTVVLGGGNTGANMALTLLYWSKDIIYVNHAKTEIDNTLRKRLNDQHIPLYEVEVQELQINDKKELTGIQLVDGTELEAEKAFTAFKGNTINNALASQVGVDVSETGHLHVNPRTKETNIKGIWAGGDLVAHSEQVTISMGDGMQAAIWIHKLLLANEHPFTN